MVSTLVVTQEGVVLSDYLDVQLLAMLGALVVPLIVSTVVKKTASDTVKTVVNIVGAALMAVIALWTNPGDTPITTQVIINTVLLSFITSLSAYKGIWKPLGATEAISSKTENFGVGKAKVGDDYEAEHAAPSEE